MSDILHAGAAVANPRGHRATPKNDKATPVQDILIAFFHKLSSIKPWVKVVELTGLSNESAKNRVKGIRGFSPDEIAMLLRSEHGGAVLNAMMAGARPKWFRDIKRQIELSDLRKRQEEQRALIERLEREAAE